jgi:hypothetical protein
LLLVQGYAQEIICPPAPGITATTTYPPQWHLVWSPANSETIACNREAVIGVYGKCPPYSWSVSGTGFSLRDTLTAEPGNVLISGQTCCGAAVVSVTDGCGNTTEGAVRGAAGTWVYKGRGCKLGSSKKPVAQSVTTYTRSDGRYKQVQQICRPSTYGLGRCAGNVYSCDCHCATGECDPPACVTPNRRCGCDPIYGCEPCLAPDSVPCKLKNPTAHWYGCGCNCNVKLEWYEWQCQP